MTPTFSISGLPTPYEKEVKVVSTVAVGLTESKYRQRGSEAIRDMGNARFAVISVEGAAIRFWPHTSPASGDGHVLPDGAWITLGSNIQIKNARFIRHESALGDATLQVSYYR